MWRGHHQSSPREKIYLELWVLTTRVGHTVLTTVNNTVLVGKHRECPHYTNSTHKLGTTRKLTQAVLLPREV